MMRIGLRKATNIDLDKYPDSLRYVILCQTISDNNSQINIRLRFTSERSFFSKNLYWIFTCFERLVQLTEMQKKKH